MRDIQPTVSQTGQNGQNNDSLRPAHIPASSVTGHLILAKMTDVRGTTAQTYEYVLGHPLDYLFSS